MDKQYWEKYYKTHEIPLTPSPFAEFVTKNYLSRGGTLVELGCGNGRDSIFFAHKGINVFAVDQCEEEIIKLKENNKVPSLDFKCADFTKLDYSKSYDYIYSRFTLHSITREQEDRLFKWINTQCKIGGYIFIEARGKKNELYMLGENVPGEIDAYIYENHYRRFADFNLLCKKLSEIGFNIDYAQESSGFAPYKNTDYIFIRIVAKKIK